MLLLPLVVLGGCGPRGTGGGGAGSGPSGPTAVATRGGVELPPGDATPGVALWVKADPGLDSRFVVRAMETAQEAGWIRFRLLVDDAGTDAPEVTFAALDAETAASGEPPPAPKPAPGTVMAGERDVDALRSVVAGAGDAVQACYARALAVAPWISGRLVVRMTIAPGGEVSEAAVAIGPVDAEALVGCVLSVCRALRFPPAAEETRVDAPFDLVPSGHETVPVAIVIGPRTITATDPVGDTHKDHTDERDLTWDEIEHVLLAATDVPLPPPRADVLPRAGLSASLLDQTIRTLAPRVGEVRIVVTPTTR